MQYVGRVSSSFAKCKKGSEKRCSTQKDRKLKSWSFGTAIERREIETGKKKIAFYFNVRLEKCIIIKGARKLGEYNWIHFARTNTSFASLVTNELGRKSNSS